MSTSAWTLEGELIQLAGKSDLAESLQSLRLIEPGDSLAALETIADWYRSGAETYGLRFAVVGCSGQRRECFMKACVAYAGATPLAEIFAEWLARRAVVKELGVNTPKLYAKASALLVEEYIPHVLSDALSRAPDRIALVRAVGLTAAKLVNAGFAPLSADDWRSRGDDVVLVDFGQDLGPAHIAHGSESGLLSEVLDDLVRSGIDLLPSELQTIGATYETALST